MDNNPILVLRLEGPFQSWGEKAKWDYRDTADFPSKSGIIGLFACAMGIERDSSEIGLLCKQLRLAIRADRPGRRCTDFHTVTSSVIRTAERKKRSSRTIVSRREYLQDASFLVAVSGPEKTILEIQKALASPQWQLYLGRKSCVPSVPLVGELVMNKTMDEIMNDWPLATNSVENIIYQIDSEDEGLRRADIRTTQSERSFTVRNVVNRVCQRSGANDSK